MISYPKQVQHSPKRGFVFTVWKNSVQILTEFQLYHSRNNQFIEIKNDVWKFREWWHWNTFRINNLNFAASELKILFLQCTRKRLRLDSDKPINIHISNDVRW